MTTTTKTTIPEWVKILIVVGLIAIVAGFFIWYGVVYIPEHTGTVYLGKGGPYYVPPHIGKPTLTITFK